MASNLLSQIWSEGTNGFTVSTANSGNPSAPFDSVNTLSAGQTREFDSSQNIHSALCCQFDTSATGAASYADWTTSFNWGSQTWFMIYVFLNAIPSSQAGGCVLSFFQAGSLAARLRISTSGHVVMTDSANANQAIGTAVVPTAAWFRIEGYVIGNGSTGQVSYNYYSSPDSTSVTETNTSGSINTLGTPDTFRLGLAQTAANMGPLRVGPVAISNLGLIGAWNTISSSDTGSGADAGSVGTTTPISSSDTGTFADAGSVSVGGGGNTAVRDSDASQTAENPALIGVSSSDTGSGADTGSVAVRTAVSSSDTGTFTDTGSAAVVSGGGSSGPGFPLVFQMASATTTPTTADTGTFTEQALVTAFVSDFDVMQGIEQQNFPGGVPASATNALQLEGFSITHAGILSPGTDAEQGVLYGVRSAQITAQWISALIQSDDWVIGSWNAPGTVTVAIEGGFMPLDVLATLTGTSVSGSEAGALQDQSLQDILDQLGIPLLDEGLGGFAVPLWTQHVVGALPLIFRASGKDSGGNVRTLQFLAYLAQFGPVTFDGPAYKNGLTVSYNASLILSAEDETGSPLPDRAYGRLMAMPPGATGWLPEEQPGGPQRHLFDTDFGFFSSEIGIATQLGGNVHVSDSDTFHGTDGQRVSTGVQHIADADHGNFTETIFVKGVVTQIHDSDSFTANSRLPQIGATCFASQYNASDDLAAANTFDGFVGRPMGKCTKKEYDASRSFPTSWSSARTPLVNTGININMCYKPNIDGSDWNSLRNSVSGLSAATPGFFRVVLWQEAQNPKNNLTGAQYISCMGIYYPLLKQHFPNIPVVFDSSGFEGPNSVDAFFPLDSNGDPLVDEIWTDMYADTFVSNNEKGAEPLRCLFYALRYGLPFGWGEIGQFTSSSHTMTNAQFGDYINFIINVSLQHLQAGGSLSHMAWFNGTGPGPGLNTIDASNDFRIPYLQQLYDAIDSRKSTATNSITGVAGGGESPSAKISTDGTLAGGYLGGRAANLIGATSAPATACPTTVSDWNTHANPTIGPLDCDKIFYQSTQTMDLWQNGHTSADNESNLPTGTVAFVTFVDGQVAGLPGYIASIPDTWTVWLCYWPRAETGYSGTAAQFVAAFENASQIIRSCGKANVKVFQDSDYAAFTNGSSASAGNWLVDPAFVDAYTISIYQHPGAADFPAAGLAGYPYWLNWVNVASGNKRQLGITEYGISGESGAAARNTQLQLDVAYLRQAFPPGGSSATHINTRPLLCWMYWWNNCVTGTGFQNNASGQYQFTDSATISTWQQIVAGTL